MSDEPPASGRPAPVVLRVKLRYTTVEQFVDRFATNVGRSGIFLASKTPRALGTEVRFELRLADDTAVVVDVDGDGQHLDALDLDGLGEQVAAAAAGRQLALEIGDLAGERLGLGQHLVDPHPDLGRRDLELVG